jgi:CheY-like chemotaxis protein
MAEQKKILIVDDDKDFVGSLRAILEANDYAVVAAHDGAAGLQMAEKEQPDLMILDVMMATKDEGFEVSRKVQQNPALKGLPIILVTGVTKDLGISYGFEPDESWLPVKSIMEKPVDPEKLLAEIEKRLA